MGYCDTSDPNDGYLKQGLCGANEYVGGIFASGAETVQAFSENAKETVSNVSRNAADVGEKAANPLTMAGLGLGVGAGGTVAVVGLGAAAALAIDGLLFNFAGTQGLGKMVLGRRR